MPLALLLLTTALAAEPAEPPHPSTAPAAPKVIETSGPTRPHPWLWSRTLIGASGWPSGLILDERAQYRVPLKRGRSIALQDTYAGVGGRVAVTPAFVDVGPRLSLAPVDFFDIDLQGGFVGYWPSSSGLLPYDDVHQSTRDKDRGDRHRDPKTAARAGWSAYASAQPTLKAKLGPIIIYDSWQFTYMHVEPGDEVTAPLTYEPYWDRLVARDDLIFQHEAGVLGEVLKGDATHPGLRVGAQLRHRWTLVSHDPSLSVGGVVMVRPVDRPLVPSIAGQVMGYVQDEDRQGEVPAMGLALVWVNDFSLADR